MSLEVQVGTLSLKLLGVLEGSYKPSREEVSVLAEVARLNKVYLAFLRRVGGELHGELLREEASYRWFLENTIEVVKALRDVDYALYKFRKPVKHVSVDLDILVRANDIPRAVRALGKHGFRTVVKEPYTVTLERRGL